MSAITAYILVFSTFIALPGVVLIQNKFNHLSTEPVVTTNDAATITPQPIVVSASPMPPSVPISQIPKPTVSQPVVSTQYPNQSSSELTSNHQIQSK